MAHNFKIKVSPKVKTAMTFSSAAFAFVLIALGSGKVTKNGIEINSLVALGDVVPGHTTTRAAEDQRKKNLEVIYKRNELYRQLDSGTRSSEELAQELSDAIGKSEPLEFKKGAFDRAYRLSMLMTHYKSADENPYEILFIHNFAINGLREEAVTLYTRRIDAAEEGNTNSNLIVPQNLELNEKQEPVLSARSAMAYLFQLEPHTIKRAFDLRDPEGQGGFMSPNAKMFDPLSLLTRKDTFENGTYKQQIIAGDERIWNTEVRLRRTEIGTLTLEIKAQEVGSNVVQTSVLVYEEL